MPLNLAARRYSIGDHVMFLSQRMSHGGLTEEAPFYRDYGYVVVEGIVTNAYNGGMIGPTAGNEGTGTINVMYMNNRPQFTQVSLDPYLLSDCFRIMRERGIDGEKLEFMEQLALPVVLSSSMYRSLLTDMAQAANVDVSTLQLADVEEMRRKAEQNGIPVLPINPMVAPVSCGLRNNTINIFSDFDAAGRVGLVTEDDEDEE